MRSKIERGCHQLGLWVLARLVSRKRNGGFFGDLEEMYQARRARSGGLRAGGWLWLQVVRTIPALVRDAWYWNAVMFKNAWTITWRTLRKQKGFSLINIGGLALGVSCGFLIFLWVRDEMSYDRFHERADSLFRIEAQIEFMGGRRPTMASPVPLAPAAEKEIPEIAAATRASHFGGVFLRQGRTIHFEEDLLAVDPAFLRMFSFPLRAGDPKTAVLDRFSILLSETSARKYFGNEDPMGKTVLIENTHPMKVTGILRDPPANSSLRFSGLVPFEFVRVQLERMPDGWGDAVSSYVLLKDQADAAAAGRKITDLVRRRDGQSRSDYRLTPLRRIHLYSDFGSQRTVGLIRYVYIFSVVALFVLAIAALNFVNLSTARSANRAREIGLRKAVGARRFDVIRQFLDEALILTGLAFLLALLLTAAALPAFNALAGKSLGVGRLFQRDVWPGLLGILVLTSLLAGAYPAVFLSSFRPARVFKAAGGGGKAKSPFRKILVVFQFAISIVLLIGMTVAARQVRFMRGASVGLDRAGLIGLRLEGETPKAYESLRSELLKIPGVAGVTASGRRPYLSNDTGQDVSWDGLPPGRNVRVVFNPVDFDFVETMGFTLVQGRSFSRDFPTDRKEAVLVNEELARLMGGPEAALGKRFAIFRMKGRVVGVVKNFHHMPLRERIEPVVLIMAPNPNWTSWAWVRVRPGRFAETRTAIGEAWRRIVPDYPFDAYFPDQDFDRIYEREGRLSGLLIGFTALAVLIAALGLFGLAAFLAERRTREIGIRKVLGAKTGQIILGFNREFLSAVALANLIAWPAAWWAVRGWLKGFAYRTSVGIGVFLLSGAAALVIALLTVSWQSAKAARTDPAVTLRHE